MTTTVALTIHVTAPKPGDARSWAQGIADHVTGEFGDTMRLRIAITDPDYVPPPPGSDRDQLPAHLLAVINIAPYMSTGCQVAQALEAAAERHPDLADELRMWARRKHASCRINNKSTGQLCDCIHHPVRIAATTDQPPDRP